VALHVPSDRAVADEPVYRALRRIGSGGMAEIFLAEELRRGRAPILVALKRARIQDDALIAGMLADEIRFGLLCKHPNVVATLGSVQIRNQTFAVLEYVDGLDLAHLRAALLTRGERFTRAQAVHIACELCKGLEHIHRLTNASNRPLGAVHRDVTPPNVLLGVDGAVKLCDFGLIKFDGERTLTEPGLIKGKFSYLAPETVLGHPPDPRADLFSVGILLWEMLTMQRLFNGSTDYDTIQLVQQAEVPALARFGADCDEVLEGIVRKALARVPDDRYRSAEALFNALFAYADWQELSCDLGSTIKTEKAAAEALATPSAPSGRKPELQAT
jgi:serine/threonine protein kinase